MEAVECGAASLAMVLAYFGRIVSLEELRVACGVSRDGSRAQHLIAAAREYGLIAKVYRKEVAELRKMPLPLIVHWNFNHFLVIEGFRGARAFLNDPASGPRIVPASEVEASFTGIVLTFQKGPTFQPGGVAPSLARSVWSRLSPSLGTLVFLFISGLLVMMTSIITPALLSIFIDDVLVKGVTSWAAPLNMALLVTAAALAVFMTVQLRHQTMLEMKLQLTMTTRLFAHLLRLPVGFYLQRGAGELSTRVSLLDRIARVLSVNLITAVLGLCAIVFYTTFMFEYDVWLAIVLLFTTLVSLAAAQWSAHQRVNLNRRLSQDQGKLMGTAMGGLQSIETLKAMGAEADFFSRWSGLQAKTLSVQQSTKLQRDLLSLVPPTLTMLNTVLILGVGGYRVMDGSLSIGMLIAFQSFVGLVGMPVQHVVNFGNAISEVEGKLGRVDDVLTAAPDPQVREPQSAPARQGKLTGLLELRQVSFGYSPRDPAVVQGVSLTVAPGSRVALVGGSGSGKSTLARLVCGLYHPWSGEILLDGVPRKQWSHDQLSHSFAVVDQEIFLFDGTVRENLTLWDPTVPEADVVRAATDACIHDEIMSRTGGYNSRVEEGGRNFSGGQAQRLEIARALVTNPTILVLDEATSALDPTTERIFDDNLRRRGCTCLIIAHRLSTIRDCDEIIVLKSGRIVQRGTHEQMRSMDGPYATLIASEEAS
jgi:NHLM bacteriocin system ABC transporter peptidase/ATP-binding protein